MIGPVTWDQIDGKRRAGGAVCFAARTAEAFGTPIQIVALAGPDADLDALAEQDVVIVEVASTLVMDHVVDAADRSIRVPITSQRRIEPADVPASWGGCSDLVLAPLLPDELDAPAIVEAIEPERLWVLAQGMQRVRTEDGAITFLDRPAEVLDELAGPATSVFLSDDETDAWKPEALEHLAAGCARVIVTSGGAGAIVLLPDQTREIAAVRADPVDTTGAGDVFATAFILALDGAAPDEAAAGRLAAGFAAAAIERVGPVPLPSRAEIEARLDAESTNSPSPSWPGKPAAKGPA